MDPLFMNYVMTAKLPDALVVIAAIVLVFFVLHLIDRIE